MAAFALEEWEWPLGQPRTFCVEPFECLCSWPDGMRLTTICAVPSRDNPAKMLVFFWPDRPVSKPLSSVFGRRPHHPPPPGLKGVLALLQEVGSSWFAIGKKRYAGNYVAVQMVSPHRRVMPFSQGRTREDLTQFFQRDSVPAYARIFQFPQAHVLVEDNKAVWDSGQKECTEFRLPRRERHRGRHSGAALFEWLQTQLNDEQSEVHFAYRWQGLNGPQRFEAWQERFPAIGSLLRVMRLIVRSEAEMTSDHYWCLRMSSSAYGQGRGPVSTPSFVNNQRYTGAPASEELNARLLRWRPLLRREYPAPIVRESQLPLCLYQFHCEQYAGGQLTVWGEETSQHDRLEAMLELREWLQGKASAEETATLFPNS